MMEKESLQEDSEGNLWSRLAAACQKLRGRRRGIAGGWQCWDITALWDTVTVLKHLEEMDPPRRTS